VSQSAIKEDAVIYARNDPGSYRLRVSLNEVAPAVWREMIVPAAASLSDLHRILQIALGWWDSHLHDFRVSGVRYEPTMPESDGEPTETTYLGSLDLRPGDVFSYRYDFGDDWSHRIEVLAILADDAEGTVPRVIAGENAAPLEDSGGPDGHRAVLAVLSGDLVDEELRDWIPAAYDPQRFDLGETNRVLLLLHAWDGL
jgi:hypothetical protein